MSMSADSCNITRVYPTFRMPHWVECVSPAYKSLRKRVTKKYGLVTLIASVAIIASISVYNYLYKRYYYTVSKKLKSIYHSHSISYALLINSEVLRIIVFWSIFSLIVITPETYGDLLFITKRLGRVSATLLPTVLFLTLRPSPLPKTMYLTLIPIHKWLSRIVVLQAFLHAVIYFFYFVHSNTIKKAWKLENIYGWMALLCFLLIAITSLAPIRRASFFCFYVNHYILSWLVVPLLYFHSRPPAKVVTLLNASVLTYQIYSRFTNTSLVNLNVYNLSENMKIVEISKDMIPEGQFEFKHSIMPSSHLRIQKHYKNPFKNVFYRYIAPLAHPYSIASLPSDKSILLVIRNSNFDLNNKDRYYITGSYDPDFDFLSYSEKRTIDVPCPGPQSFVNSLISSKTKSSQIQKFLKSTNIISLSSHYAVAASRVLMIAGGSGISVTLPLLRILNIQGIPSKIIWVIKDIEDLKLFKFFKNIDINSIEIYLTGKNFRFEYFKGNTLKLDDLFNKLDEDEHAIGKNKDIDAEYHGNSSYLDEIDFTTYGPKKDSLNTDAENVTGLNNALLDEPSPVPPSSKPLLSRRKTKSFSSFDTPSLSDQSSTRSRIPQDKQSLRHMLINNLNLETYFTQAKDDDDDDIKGINADNVGINISKNFNNYDTRSRHGGEEKLHGSKSISHSLFSSAKSSPAVQNLNSSQNQDQHQIQTLPNYGSIGDCRVVFESPDTDASRIRTERKSPIRVKSNEGMYSGILKQLKIFRGRPTLGQDEFNWCLNHVCGGSGGSDCENETDNEVDFNTVSFNAPGTINETSSLLSHSHVRNYDTAHGTESSSSSAVGSHSLGPKSSFEAHTHAQGQKIKPKVPECCKDIESADLDEIVKKVWVVGVGPHGLTEKTKLWARENRLNFHEESFSL